MPTIRPADPSDAATWLEMRCALWPDGSEAEHRGEITDFFAGRAPTDSMAVLIARDLYGEALGFAELSIRPFAEGCVTRPVAYLEGWYVKPEARRSGVGRALVAAAENWGREKGCSEFASDVEPANSVSIQAHLATGFTDVGLIRCFYKTL